MSQCIYYPLRSRVKTNCHATSYFGFLATESSLTVKLSISSSFSFLIVKMSSDAKEESGSHVEDGEKPPLSPSKVVHAGPTKRRTSSGSPEASPPHGKKFPFKIPSPVPTRRTRTSSQWVHSNNCCQLVDISDNGRQPRRFLADRKTIHWSGVINLIQFQIV